MKPTDSRHHLKWWNDKWGPEGDQSDANARLRFFVTCQRNHWPRGYAMRQAFRNTSLTGKNVLSYVSNQAEEADHWNIAYCNKTVRMLADAIGYLKQ